MDSSCQIEVGDSQMRETGDNGRGPGRENQTTSPVSSARKGGWGVGKGGRKRERREAAQS